PTATNKITLDSVTGDFYWDSPDQMGEYNIAILIEEWRNGIKIGSVERDMQIIISTCNNLPPQIEALEDTCIEAGKTLTFNVSANDNTNIILSATGGPFVLTDSPATITPDPATGYKHVTTTFSWTTLCTHVKRRPYNTYFKAIDDGQPVQLANIKSMKILVVGPAPKNLTALALGNTITLNWNAYACPNAKGYYIYRKADSTGFIPGYCQTGVPPYLGFTRIDQLNDIAVTNYVDNNLGSGLVQGVKYCYLIVAWYSDRAESYASNEACASLRKDVAVITNVSINTTDQTHGSIYVAWSKPTELDTLLAPGPYMYKLLRLISGTQLQFIEVDSLFNLNDTIFTDTLINTRDFPTRYRVDFYNLTPGNRFLIGSSQIASSIYLTVAPTDKKLKLRWNNDVPWSNYRFVIYRLNNVTTLYDSIGFSDHPTFDDGDLKNGKEYCYFIKSVGKYSTTGFVYPIFNLSQRVCGSPYDNIPPCPPFLLVRTDCDKEENLLTWTNPGDTCGRDIVKYYIFHSTCNQGSFALLDSVYGINDTTYLHKPLNTIAACYAVMAVDSVGNRSRMSDTVCITVDSCSQYQIPNVFTPNGDEYNQLLIPKKYTSVDHISLEIIDRWGRSVFKTNDPAIRWDGTDMTTHQPCSDGTYFYLCDVYENSLCGTVKRTLKGTITILR
ncbi:MAG: gliding motility-associated C-terminal domain-containing protein, partial [Bacteroidota bacterium]